MYDLYLLVMSRDNHALGIIGMQINDTLILRNAKFLMREQTEIDKAGFLTKPA